MRSLGVLISFVSAALSWQYIFEESENAECHESCFTTTIGAYQTVKSPIWFSQRPSDSFERSKFSGVNDTAFEQWYFEAVSEAGDAFIVSLGHDPSYKALGYGVLPFEIILVFANGTRHATTDFAIESRVRDCCGQVRGLWKTKTGSVSWSVSADLKAAMVYFDTPTVQGRAELQSFTPARFADGTSWPSNSAQTQLAPHLNFVETIPVAHAKVDLKVQDSRLTFFGIGGHFHDWAAFDWFTLVDSWRNMRAKIGPYAFSLWIPRSRIAGGIQYSSGVLYKDGIPIVKVYGPDNDTSQERNKLSICGHFDGTISGRLGDKSSGWIIEFAEPRSSRRWRFSSKHQVLAHEVMLGSESGLSVFTDEVKGGEFTEEQHSGYGLCEQIILPKSIGPSAAWEVFKTHRDNTGSTTWQAVWYMFSAVCRDGVLTNLIRILLPTYYYS
ncbi:hypothetical protein P153DRAFT_353984 [Dothidotthia symphoricarpi CBS 119687]|uniref:AttH domain-containing protein n=1 Tax=Dothidotthia symphoricarpi CBS 119687 TaxID=1392245 RepID=A0A6A6AKI9_9PLEO|nr:uncharacterized protein P153DRAFT_353984 [Dothidotthia symphoricarpi CBS 119687]KAF2132472.1 hypothetical protein P153DRAFT_353984 [Dothidotthia symphoricarpi CBS 119687]